MSELTIQWISFIKLLVVACSALMYGLGGLSGKWRRRYISPAILTTAFVGFSLVQGSFSWWFLLCYPLYVLAFSLGYGVNSNNTGLKIFKRTYVALAIAAASLPIAVINGAWIMFALHVAVVVLVSNVLGILNPVSARAEETIIGFSSGLFPMFML